MGTRLICYFQSSDEDGISSDPVGNVLGQCCEQVMLLQQLQKHHSHDFPPVFAFLT